MIKKIFSFIACIVMMTAVSVVASAASEYGDERVVDRAGLFTDSEENSLREITDKIKEEFGFDCVMVTVNSYYNDNMLGAYSPMDLSDYAYKFYNNGDYGYNGIIFVVSMSTREWWFLQFGEGKTIISDSYGLEWLEYKVLDELKDGEYYECFDKFASSVYDFAKEATNNKPYSTGNPYLDFEAYWGKIKGKLIVIIIICVAALALIAWILIRTMKTVKKQPDANSYVKSGSFNLYFRNDTFMYSNTTRTRVNSGSRGGRGGGGSRGGRGGRF